MPIHLGEDLLTRITSLAPKDVLMLRSLSIPCACPRVTQLLYQSQFLMIPTLKHLSLCNYNNGIAGLPVYWDCLTSLELFEGGDNALIVTAISSILQQITNLIHLTLDTVDFDPVFVSQSIYLPFLQTFIVTNDYMYRYPPVGFNRFLLIDHISAPLLEELAFDKLPPILSLITFLKQLPSLRRLTLPYYKVTLVELTEILSHCPLLTRLRCIEDSANPEEEFRIHDEQACNAFLEAFIHEDATKSTCPRLEHFLFEGAMLDVSVDVFRRFLIRKHGLSCWKEVRVHIVIDDKEKKEQLRELNRGQKDLGLKLKFHY